MRFAVVRSLFNAQVTQALLDGAKRGFADAKIEPDLVDAFDVPGAFELPLAALWLAQTKKYNAVVCLGCVIRGQTPHFEHVSNEVSKGVAQVSLQSGVPVSFGVLTTDTIEQAIERAGTKAGNKGWDAAVTAVEMVALGRALADAGL